jgi:hypothetical protein
MVVFLIVMLAFGALGVYTLSKGGLRLRKVFHILRNDPRPVRELQTYRGPVEIQGRAVEGDNGTVEAQFSGSRCLAYNYEVEELQSSNNNHNWETLDVGAGGVEFVVEDDTGRVRVDPAGADFHFEDHTVTVHPGEELPDRLADFVARSPDVEPQNETLDLQITELNTGNRQRFIERRLDVGEDVYVYGQVRQGPSGAWGSDLVDALVGRGDETPVFVISDTDESGTARRIARDGILKVVIGVVALGVSVLSAFLGVFSFLF